MCALPDKDAIAAQEALVGALANPVCYPHPVERVRVIETHISHVLLTGRYAYKIKKPVDLGFLDFSTLERRRFYCEEELRLNRRLAPQMYLEVVAIGGTPQAPQLGVPAEEAIEYAVKMREFPQEALLDHRLGLGELSIEHIDAIAAVVAAFHQRVERAAPQQGYGSAAHVQTAVWQTFAQIRPLLGTAAEREALDELEAWSEREHATLLPLFVERQCQGYVRECHGDLHLGNIALVDDEIQVFDGIEFNPNLRWIDVISEIAFLVMDLDEHGRPDLAWRFLNR
jgi:aminoglycoside phosphotransferase family enzyme